MRNLHSSSSQHFSISQNDNIIKSPWHVIDMLPTMLFKHSIDVMVKVWLTFRVRNYLFKFGWGHGNACVVVWGLSQYSLHHMQPRGTAILHVTKTQPESIIHLSGHSPGLISSSLVVFFTYLTLVPNIYQSFLQPNSQTEAFFKACHEISRDINCKLPMHHNHHLLFLIHPKFLQLQTNWRLYITLKGNPSFHFHFLVIVQIKTSHWKLTGD